MEKTNDPKTIGFYTMKGETNSPVVGWVVPINGSFKGKSFMLSAGFNFIGKASNVDVLLNDDLNIIDRHAAIVYDPKSGKFFVKPEDEYAVVLLDEQQIFNDTELINRQIITVGSTKLMFVAFCGEKFNWT